MYYELDPSVIN